MASIWRKATHYLGLGPEDEYDDDLHDEAPAYAGAVAYERGESSSGGGAVRALPREPREQPREREEGSTLTASRPRPGVVRSITPAPAPAGTRPFPISPAAFNDAQEIADRYMGGNPVIMNLQGVERDLSRRLVDFASGLCYGLRGQMERVADHVYLITPNDVEVATDDRRRPRERAAVQ